jgi:hypothetical protein
VRTTLIISDIDDTVVRTEVTNWVRMLKIVLLTNAYTRTPFEHVETLYQAFRAAVPAAAATRSSTSRAVRGGSTIYSSTSSGSTSSPKALCSSRAIASR